MIDNFFHDHKIKYVSSINCDDFDLLICPSKNICNIDNSYKNIIEQRKSKEDSQDDIFLTQLPNSAGSNFIFINELENNDNLVKWLHNLSKTIKDVSKNNISKLALDFNNCNNSTSLQVLRVVLAHWQDMPNFKKDHKFALPEIHISGKSEDIFRDILHLNDGNAIGRYLALLPSNHLTPDIYVQYLESFAKIHGFKYEIYDQNELLKLGAGAFNAVSQSSNGGAIVKLSYFGDKKTDKIDLSLVGKGVCFDTGGISIKPAQYMAGMNQDMMGSSVALGSFYVLAKQNTPKNITCYMAIVQNNINEKAYVPDDVVKALNGKTIEIVNTDAEGRMVLADTLTLSSRDNPKMIIDYATLTGTALRAIGTEYNCVFSNNSDWYFDLIECGKNSGEPVWPFPIADCFDRELKSDIADLKQCKEGGNPDHIIAAQFLLHFVEKDIKWLHVDMSAGNNKGGVGAINTDTTASGVWFTNLLIKDLISKNKI